MRQRGLRALVLGVATVTLAAGLPAAPGQAAPQEATAAKAAPQQAQPAGRTAPITITLITGDRVTVHGDRVGVEAGPGRAGMRFLERRDAGHRYVIPADALPLLHSGRLDERLFDLTTLISFGYDDRAGDLPLLVTYPTSGSARGPAAARSAATVAGSQVIREVPGAGLLGVRVARDSRTTLWRSLTTGPAANRGLRAGVEKIWLNGKRTINLDASVPQIGAPAAWKAGLDGKGITVAVLDTGVDTTHPDLKGQVVGSQNFTEEPDADDTVGHGTHVASTIAGTGAASAGRFRGVAPGAKLLNGKVCMLEGCDELWILAGMEWAAQQGAQVVNMSLGGRDTPGIDPLEKSVQDLTAKYGTLFVIAAGNSGPYASSVGSPASADTALAVGAVDRKDKLADFSSRGPRVGDDAVKPEITAPGVEIVAAKAAKDVIGDPATVKGYTTMSGTSMATPHVAGAAAILTQQHPDWSPAQRKTALMGSAKRTKGAGVFDQGAGRVDLTRAIKQTVVAEPGSVSFGRALWPHTDDKPIIRTVTYRNTGSAAVTLTLKAQGSGPTGKAAPAGFFKLAATKLTVPAGGTARTTLTANTRVKAVDGVYSGYLTATAPGVQVQTPFAVNREVESYNVKLVHTNRDGTKAKDYFTVLTDLASFTSYDVFGTAPTTTLRLPKGTYGLFSWIATGSETKEDITDDTTSMLVQPKLTVSRSSTVKLDARLGRPVKITVPKKDAAPTLVSTGAEWTGKNGGTGAGAVGDRFEGQFTAQIGPKTKVKGFTGSVNASFARLDAKGSAAKSPYLYDLAYYRTGSFYTGFTKAVQAKELATLATTYRAQGVGVQGVKSNWARVPGVSGGISAWTPFDLPRQRTEYVNAEKGVTWGAYFEEILPSVDEEQGPEFIAGAFQPATGYRAGRTYRQEWNRAVFAPSVRGATYEGDWLSRLDNTIAGGVPLFSDGAGHVGWSRTSSERVALYRNGRLVGESAEQFGEFAVPAGAASYRFEMSAERGAPATLSTRVEAAWTFKSARVTGTKPKRLPLSSVRFSPVVDLNNTAKAGRTVEIGIGIDRQAGSTATKNKSLTVEVSYDDGRTWKRVTVRGSGDARTAVVAHPATAGFVSLRATAADTAGNTVKQTVIRAYRIA